MRWAAVGESSIGGWGPFSGGIQSPIVGAVWHWGCPGGGKYGASDLETARTHAQPNATHWWGFSVDKRSKNGWEASLAAWQIDRVTGWSRS
jgi:hypothetical protein